MSDELAEIRQLFFEECEELLGALDTQLLAFEAGTADADAINSAFRAIHSIKGGAGAFALTDLIGFAHTLETALDALRSGQIVLTPELAALFRRSADRLSDHVGAARMGTAGPLPDALEDELTAVAGKREEVDVTALFAGEPTAPVSPAIAAQAETPPQIFTVQLRPRRDLFRRAVEPLVLIRILRDYGHVKVQADLTQVPPFADLDPGECWLGFTVTVETDATAEILAAALEPFIDADEVTIEALPAPETEDARATAPGPNTVATLPVLSAPPSPVNAAAPEGRSATGGVAQAPPNPTAAAGGSIRVDIGRIDRLVNLVGEIVVVQALLSERTPDLDSRKHGELVDAVSALSRQSRELHEAVMAVRAQPVRTVFQRMPRLIRELSQLLGKQARLDISGEHTEVDKTIIEELAEPLTHMLRNSMDHGLETPAERVAAGKPPEGQLLLAAEHRGGRILITVSDDGRGIDRERLLNKAMSRGLISEGARLSPEDIDNLIFHPGLSTAEKISDVSGRGVGMDVVKRSIQAIGGRITLNSEPGRGCRFTLALPLTLAVLDGMVLRVGGERYVVPLQSVVETLRVDRLAIERLPGGRDLLRIRDRLAPLVALRDIVGKRAENAHRDDDVASGIVIIAETDTGQRLALLADEILGQQQVVVKSLEQSYGSIPGISGASILGDGRISLILDVDSFAIPGADRPWSDGAIPAQPLLEMHA